MARENLLWQWMHEHGRHMRMLDMRRVENYLTKGTPDVDLCYWAHQAWVELKGCNAPVNASSQLRYELTPLQAMWLTRRWDVGGSSWVYFRVGINRGIRRYLVPGYRAGELEKCVPEGMLASMSLLPPDHGFNDFLGRVCTRSDFNMDLADFSLSPGAESPGG